VLRSRLLPIFLIVLVDILGMTIVLPLLAVYAESFHATPFLATLLVSSYAMCQLISGPLLGRISDHSGRRPMLIISQIGTFIGFLIMARATTLWMLFIARIIDGATAGNLSLAQAYISDHTEPKDRAKSFALIGIAFGIGFLFGPAITAYFSSFGLNAPIYVASLLSFTSICCTYFMLPKENKSTPPSQPMKRLSLIDWNSYIKYFRQPIMRGLLLQFFAYLFAFATFTSGFALFAERRFVWHAHPFTPREIGILFSYSGLLGIIFQGGMIGRLVKQFGEGRLVGWAFFSLIVGYLLLGSIHQIPLLIIATTILSFGHGTLRPTLTSLITQNANRQEQGVVLGLTQSLASIALILAPLLAGYLIGIEQTSAWAFVAAVAALTGLFLRRWGSALVSES